RESANRPKVQKIAKFCPIQLDQEYVADANRSNRVNRKNLSQTVWDSWDEYAEDAYRLVRLK
ncbi:hypothetical protein KI387_005966, partial [Taxus chinensis]